MADRVVKLFDPENGGSLVVRGVRKLTPTRLLVIGFVLCGTLSLAITYMPYIVLRWILKNGVVENQIQTTEAVKSFMDTWDKMRELALIRLMFGVMRIWQALMLMPAIIAVALLSNPSVLRSLLGLGTAPAAACGAIWFCIIMFTKAFGGEFSKTIQSAPPGLKTCAVGAIAAVLCAAGAMGASHLLPVLTAWATGDVPPQLWALLAALGTVLGSILAALHMEGNRDATTEDMSTPKGKAITHALHVSVACMAMLAMVLIVPRLNPTITARLRLTDMTTAELCARQWARGAPRII